MAIFDQPERYGAVSRAFHWGMAVLFAAQFLSAAAHMIFPRDNVIREVLWSYHTTLGATLFLLVLLRGLWGFANMSRRPAQEPGLPGRAARAGHAALYALMVIVPGLRLLAAAGSTRGFSYLGLEIFPPRETAVAWMGLPAELHGALGWLLAVLVVGHMLVAVVWHQRIRQDTAMRCMTVSCRMR